MLLQARLLVGRLNFLVVFIVLLRTVVNFGSSETFEINGD